MRQQVEWVVANPGSIPELTQLAAWLDRESTKLLYLSPIVNSPRIGGLDRSLFASLLAQRYISWTGSQFTSVRSIAFAREMAYLMLQKEASTRNVALKVLAARTRAFDRGVSRVLKKSSHRRIVIARSTAARETLRCAREVGAKSILDHPIVHHRILKEILDQERSRWPALAVSMEGDVHREEVLERMDEELALADRVLALNSWHAETLVRGGVDVRKIVVSELGVDVSQFAPNLDPDLRAPHKLLFVGQVNQRKGIAYLLEVLKALPSKFTLTAVGAVGAGVREFVQAAGLTDRVQLVGSLPRTSLARYYQSAGVFLFPTLAEGFPQTPLEAMACGTPVIVSRAAYGEDGPVKDGSSGFVVDARDVQTQAAEVVRLAEDRSLADRVGKAARASAEQYTWGAFSERLVRAGQDLW